MRQPVGIVAVHDAAKAAYAQLTSTGSQDDDMAHGPIELLREVFSSHLSGIPRHGQDTRVGEANASAAERLSPAVGLQRIPRQVAGVACEGAAQSVAKPVLANRASASCNIGP